MQRSWSKSLSTRRGSTPANRPEGKGATHYPEVAAITAKQPTPKSVQRELAPQVDQRQPATGAEPTIPSSLPKATGKTLELAEHEKENFLQEAHAFLMTSDSDFRETPLDLASPSPRQEEEALPHMPMELEDGEQSTPAPQETPEPVASRLLKLRKDYRRTTVALAKATSHSEFVSTCKNKGLARYLFSRHKQFSPCAR